MTAISLYPLKKWQINLPLIVTWLYSLIALSCSFYQQYIAQIDPCYLCKLQRLPFFAIFLITPIGFIANFNQIACRFLQLFFLISLCLALYHLLIQFGLVNEQCIMNQTINNREDFLLLLTKPSISCSEIKWKIFGMPITAYNLIFSLFFLFYLRNRIQKLNFSCI
jgi:disulfide bond formation protein DsbB